MGGHFTAYGSEVRHSTAYGSGMGGTAPNGAVGGEARGSPYGASLSIGLKQK